jgi:ketosteroid isomerase-like protein
LTPREFLRDYEKKANSHHFDDVAPLISEDAIFWFNDGSFRGMEAIRQAFEKTWSYDIQDEKFWLDNIEWLVEENDVAACAYLFHWTGMVNGELRDLGHGRGTCVLKKKGDWKIVHEHLSRIP